MTATLSLAADGGWPSDRTVIARVILLDTVGIIAFGIFAGTVAPQGPLSAFTVLEWVVAVVGGVASLTPLLVGVYLLVDHIHRDGDGA